jgi:Protein of unknown function (DUF3313)
MDSSPHRFTFVLRIAASAGLGVSLSLAGCASTRPVAYQDLSSASELKPVKGYNQFQYMKPNDPLKNYDALVVDPVSIYNGADAQFGPVSQQGRQEIAVYMQQEFTKLLGKKMEITDSPKPGTVRLHLTLTGIEKSTPVMSPLSHLLPVGLLVNAGFEAAGHNGSFFGSVSYAIELYDVSTGELIYAAVSKETPRALDLTSSFGRLDAAKTGVRHGAEHLCKDLEKDHIAKVAPNAAKVGLLAPLDLQHHS